MNHDRIAIATLGPEDWRTLRAIRLDAYRSEPAAFSTTHAEALARPEADWRERLAAERSIHLAAVAGGHVVGMVGGHLAPGEDDQTVAVVFGMYVRDAYRGKGIGRLLLGALLARLGGQPRIETVRLWVRPAQRPAMRLYESFGFRVVGEDDDGSGRELIMERPAGGLEP
jgi:ribosomal protein S18 acetylase RimI-like enzyme